MATLNPLLQVKEVSENPLAKVSELVGDGGDGRGRKRRRGRGAGAGRADLQGDKALETQILESSIHKICSLLLVRRRHNVHQHTNESAP